MNDTESAAHEPAKEIEIIPPVGVTIIKKGVAIFELYRTTMPAVAATATSHAVKSAINVEIAAPGRGTTHQ